MAPLDYLVLALYFAAVILLGTLCGRGQKTGVAYFLADRSVHWFPAAITMTAVSVSTITFIGMPGQAFRSDWTFLQLYLTIPAASWIVLRWFLPAYHKLGVSTAYEYLERRFDRRVRRLAGAAFQIIAVGSAGVVLYAPSIVFAEMTGSSVGASILVLGAVTTVYTLFGGVRAVIYTDLLQAFVFLAGWAVAAWFLVRAVPGGAGQIWDTGLALGKLRTFDGAIWGAVLGMTFTHVALSGVNQAQVQKYLSVASVEGGRRAILGHGLLLLAVYVAFFALGTGLFVYYQGRPESLPEGIAADRVFPFFILRELPAGLRGFLLAGAFAAAMSTLSSALNTLANVTLVDFLGHVTVARAKLWTLAWGVVVAAAAVAAWRLGPILELIVRVNAYCYGCLLGVFLLGMLTRRGTARGAMAGLGAGIALVALLATVRPEWWIWFGAAGCLTCLGVGYRFST